VVDNGGAFDVGGIWNSGRLFITNSTMARNSTSAGAEGGALVNAFGTTVLLNATIAGRDIIRAPVIRVNSGTVTLQNTIVAHGNIINCVSGVPPAGTPPGSILSLGNNLIGEPRGCPITLQPSDLTGDPGLDTFRDNGMPGNGHFPLLPTSQAIDAGNDAVCPRTDQLGRRRIGPCDIGAIEFRNRDDRQHDEEDEEDDEPDVDPVAATQASQ
jgi:hypothetical protein